MGSCTLGICVTSQLSEHPSWQPVARSEPANGVNGPTAMHSSEISDLTRLIGRILHLPDRACGSVPSASNGVSSLAVNERAVSDHLRDRFRSAPSPSPRSADQSACRWSRFPQDAQTAPWTD